MPLYNAARRPTFCYHVTTFVVNCGGPMETIGVRELKAQASEILRRVREEGSSYEVTYRGRAIARLVPIAGTEAGTSVAALRSEWEQLSSAISAQWPAGISAVEAVHEGRREL